VKVYKNFRYSYNKGEEFDGIINYLTTECGGNVHEKGIVNVTCSGSAPNTKNCWQVADYGSNTSRAWSSSNVPIHGFALISKADLFPSAIIS
jgi:hypothetical protein